MIEQKFLAAFNQLLAQQDFIADDMQTILQRLTDTVELDAEKEALQVGDGYCIRTHPAGRESKRQRRA